VTVRLLVLSDATSGGKSLLPALEFLGHTLGSGTLTPEGLAGAGDADLILVDATQDLGKASLACRMNATSEAPRPCLVVVPDGALAALKVTWGFDDWVLPQAQPAEVETRLRLVVERSVGQGRGQAASIGELNIDEDTYVVRLRGIPLDLTFREFELLKYLATNPDACSRAITCCRRSGATTTTAGHARSTSTSAGCAPSWAPSTRR
jgi:DNA-binding response OmpR family regulator